MLNKQYSVYNKLEKDLLYCKTLNMDYKKCKEIWEELWWRKNRKVKKRIEEQTPKLPPPQLEEYKIVILKNRWREFIS